MIRFFSIVIFLFPLIAGAQDADVTKYFDDGGMGNPRNAIKVDILQAVGGDVVFSYERFLHDAFSLEVGAGFLRGKYLPPFLTAIDNEEFLSEREGGYKFVITPMFHPYEDPRDGLIYGLQFFVRQNKGISLSSSNEEAGTYDRTDTYIGYYQGYRFEIGDYLSMELAFSGGFIFFDGGLTNTVGTEILDGSQFNILTSLKLAFHK